LVAFRVFWLLAKTGGLIPDICELRYGFGSGVWKYGGW